MPKTVVLMPLANDAEVDPRDLVYTDIGPNMKQRIDEAVAWQQQKHQKFKTALWCFGAGTAEEFRRGSTLGTLAMRYLKKKHVLDTTCGNEQNHNFYGTYEEIKWCVQNMKIISRPEDTLFVLFGPRWQLWRARFI